MENAVRSESCCKYDEMSEEQFSELVLDVALRHLYRPEHIFAQKVVRLKQHLFRITFRFSQYTRPFVTPGHVPSNQMGEALIEAMLCVFCASALSGFAPFGAVKERVSELEKKIVHVRQETTYRRIVPERAEDFLEMKIEPVSLVRLRHTVYLLTFSYDGFARGSSDFILDADTVRATVGRDLIDDRAPLRRLF